MEKYLIIYHDVSNDWESDPDLLEMEKDRPFLFDTFAEAEEEIKADIDYWKHNRPDINDVTIIENGYTWTVQDSYGSCKYYIRKIFI